MDEKTKEKIKRFFTITFNLQFTTSKFLAYIIAGLGAWISLELKTDSPFTVGVIASTALFGVKVLGVNKDAKKIAEDIKKNEDAI